MYCCARGKLDSAQALHSLVHSLWSNEAPVTDQAGLFAAIRDTPADWPLPEIELHSREQLCQSIWRNRKIRKTAKEGFLDITGKTEPRWIQDVFTGKDKALKDLPILIWQTPDIDFETAQELLRSMRRPALYHGTSLFDGLLILLLHARAIKHSDTLALYERLNAQMEAMFEIYL